MAPKKANKDEPSSKHVLYSIREENAFKLHDDKPGNKNKTKNVQAGNGSMEDHSTAITSTLQSQKQFWKESSLRPILTEYGLDRVTKNETEKRKKEKKPKPIKKRQHNEDYDDDKQKAKRERYLQQYEDVQRMRALYYKVYLQQLNEKVQAQRGRIRKKSEIFETKLRAQEEKDAHDSHHLKRRLPRHRLDNNEEFVRHVPKSAHYKILALQNKLKSEGQLRTQQDIDKFWAEVTDPDMLRKYLILYKPLPTESSDASSKAPGSVVALSQTEQNPQQQQTQTPSMPSETVPEATIALHKMDKEFRPMTKIQESLESSRPQTCKMTAEESNRDLEATTDRKKLDPATIAKMAAAELEKKCPQMDLPEMACFLMDLADNPQNPDEVLSGIAAERRQKERRLFVKRLRRMYHLSTANGATAQRILSLHDNTDEAELDNPGISDLIAIDEITRDLDRTLRQVTAEPSLPEIQRPWLRHVDLMRRKSIVPIQEEPYSDSCASSATSSASKKRQLAITNKNKSDAKNVQFAQRRKPTGPPTPLTLKAVQSNVVEAKCLSTMWNNYLHAGKSKFADIEV